MWDRKYFENLLELCGDVGGKQIMKDYMEAVLLMETDAAELRDVDVPSDLTYSCQK